jgi:hypothetical protein
MKQVANGYLFAVVVINVHVEIMCPVNFTIIFIIAISSFSQTLHS